MRLVNFEIDGHGKYGVVFGDGVIDLSARLGGTYPTLLSLIERNGIARRMRRLARRAPGTISDRQNSQTIRECRTDILCGLELSQAPSAWRRGGCAILPQPFHEVGRSAGRP